jgi:hypothetical protein
MPLKTSHKILKTRPYRQIEARSFVQVPLVIVWNRIQYPGEIADFHSMMKSSIHLGNQRTGLNTERYCELKPVGFVKERVVSWQEGKGMSFEAIEAGAVIPCSWMRSSLELFKTAGGTWVVFNLKYQLKWGLLGWLIDYFIIQAYSRRASIALVEGLRKISEEEYQNTIQSSLKGMIFSEPLETKYK